MSQPRARISSDRQYHTTSLHCSLLTVSPDPVSNIRPVKYASAISRRQTPNSPYSVEEFPTASSRYGAGRGSGDAEGSRAADLELEYRLRRERVDAMNHHFWVGPPP